jgi:hypothetical protein
MLTTRFWGGTTVLLCTLLFQDCQPSSLSVTEEEAPAIRQRASSGGPATQSLAPLSASPVAHIPLSRFSTTPATKQTPSTAPYSLPLSPLARHVLVAVGNYRAPYNLQPASGPMVSHAVPLGNTPGHAPSPDGPRVYLGRTGLLGGMPSDEKENAKPPTKRRPTDLDDEVAKGNEKARDGEGCEQGYIRRDALNTLLCIAVSAPDKAAEFLEISLAAAQDNQFRQQALEALGKVAQAPSDMLSARLPSLRAAAKEGDKAVRLLALRILGEAEWKHYFGDVGPAPALPGNIGTILDSACPFWPRRKVRDTHLLVLIPATVDGALFTLNLLGELIQRPKNGGHTAEYEYYSDNVKAQFGAASPDRSYWLLMTRDVSEGSRSKSYSNQKTLVAHHVSRTGHPYEVPRALEAATAILMHYARTGERLFGDAPLTYTRCQELEDGGYPIVVGGFDSSGLRIDYDFNYDHYCGGVAGCRKF